MKGMMELWKNGIMGNKELPLKPNFPIFHYSSIPGCLLSDLCVLCGEDFFVPPILGI
jgi:hypothetical protein